MAGPGADECGCRSQDFKNEKCQKLCIRFMMQIDREGDGETERLFSMYVTLSDGENRICPQGLEASRRMDGSCRHIAAVTFGKVGNVEAKEER